MAPSFCWLPARGGVGTLTVEMVNNGILQNWQVYIILCSDNSFYTGITTDIERRFRKHADGNGAKYFRGRQPLQLVYLENNHIRSSATKREFKIKAMNHTDKALLVLQQSTISNL